MSDNVFERLDEDLKGKLIKGICEFYNQSDKQRPYSEESVRYVLDTDFEVFFGDYGYAVSAYGLDDNEAERFYQFAEENGYKNLRGKYYYRDDSKNILLEGKACDLINNDLRYAKSLEEVEKIYEIVLKDLTTAGNCSTVSADDLQYVTIRKEIFEERSKLPSDYDGDVLGDVKEFVYETDRSNNTFRAEQIFNISGDEYYVFYDKTDSDVTFAFSKEDYENNECITNSGTTDKKEFMERNDKDFQTFLCELHAYAEREPLTEDLEEEVER